MCYGEKIIDQEIEYKKQEVQKLSSQIKDATSNLRAMEDKHTRLTRELYELYEFAKKNGIKIEEDGVGFSLPTTVYCGGKPIGAIPGGAKVTFTPDEILDRNKRLEKFIMNFPSLSCSAQEPATDRHSERWIRFEGVNKNFGMDLGSGEDMSAVSVVQAADKVLEDSVFATSGLLTEHHSKRFIDLIKEGVTRQITRFNVVATLANTTPNNATEDAPGIEKMSDKGTVDPDAAYRALMSLKE